MTEPETFPIDQILARDVQPRKLFNNLKMVADLYKMTQANVLGFFDEINQNKQKYGITDPPVIQQFPGVVNRIRTIVQNGRGPIFLNPTMTIPFLGTTLEVRNLYDLVGWIFSVAAGKIDKKADRNDYYLPLICVYCVFCRRLTEKLTVTQNQFGEDTLAADPMNYDPTMTQISWFNNPEDDQIYFSLSANLDCWPQSVRDVYQRTKNEVQRNRAGQFKDLGIIGNVDVNARPVGGSNKYGMCAETVPFLFIKLIMKKKTKVPFKRDSVNGFAFEGYKILPQATYKSDSIKAEGPLRLPCKTCEMLIKSDPLKFEFDNFKNVF